MNISSNTNTNTNTNINTNVSSFAMSSNVQNMVKQFINILLITFNEFNKDFKPEDIQNFFERVEDESFPEFIIVGTQESTVVGSAFKKHFQDVFQTGVEGMGYQLLGKINGKDYISSPLIKTGLFGKNVRTRVYYNTQKIMTQYVFNENQFKANGNNMEAVIIHEKNGDFNNGVTKTMRLGFQYCHNDCGFEPEKGGLTDRNLQKGAILTRFEINDGDTMNLGDYMTNDMNQLLMLNRKMEEKREKTNRRLFLVNTHLLFASNLPDLGNMQRLRQMMLILKRFNLPDELLVKNTMLVFHGDLNFRINKGVEGNANTYKQLVREFMEMDNRSRLEENQLYESLPNVRELKKRNFLPNHLRPLFFGRDTSAFLAEVLEKLIESVTQYPFEFTCIFDHHKAKLTPSNNGYVNGFAYKKSEGMMPSVCDRILYTTSDENIYFKPRITPVPIREKKSDHIGLTGIITIYPGEMDAPGYGFYEGGARKKRRTVRKSRKTATKKKTSAKKKTVTKKRTTATKKRTVKRTVKK